MQRISSIRAFRPATSSRFLSNSVRLMAAGDTGSARSGGVRSGDAFTKREAANEDMYIKEQEKEKLRELKQKLAAQKQHIVEMEKHIDELSKSQGGEHN